MTIAVFLFLLGCVTVIYPIRAIGLRRRSWGVVMIIGAVAMSAAASPDVKRTASASSSTSAGFSSSGGCKTDASGTYRCDSEASFGSLGSSSSKTVCRKNPVTDQTDCKWETNTR